MAAGGEEHHVVAFDATLLPRPRARVEDVEELPGEALVRQVAAASRRRGPVGDAELPRKLHLALPRAAADRLEALPVHQPLTLGDLRGQELRRERAQEPAVEAAVPLDDAQGVAPLALRALTQHLSGEDELSTLLFHDLARAAHHEHAAVDARIR